MSSETGWVGRVIWYLMCGYLLYGIVPFAMMAAFAEDAIVVAEHGLLGVQTQSVD